MDLTFVQLSDIRLGDKKNHVALPCSGRNYAKREMTFGACTGRLPNVL